MVARGVAYSFLLHRVSVWKTVPNYEDNQVFPKLFIWEPPFHFSRPQLQIQT